MFDTIDQSHKETIIELLEELLDIYKEDNWLIVKKYIMRYSQPKIRKYFSTRNSQSYKHTLNDFEISLINYCSDNYDISLKLYEEDKHYEK
tara:strand:- start:440 stop:712 length:273 start_codon:yes stop_codon:yes gene_type:complete